MELYLIRHGQSANNLREQALAAHGGALPAVTAPRMADPPLTDLGKQQARLAGESLRDEGITTLYCGPMLRTLQTARIIGELLDLSPHVFVGLHEWGGVWEPRSDENSVQLPGLTRNEMSATFPGYVLPADVTDRGWWFHDWAGDRAMLELAHRNALSFIAHLEEDHGDADHRIAAILHSGSGSSLVSALFGIPLHTKWQERFVHDNAGISRISITPDHRQLRYLNRIDHLSNTDARSKPPR
ncbi:MAG: histidine phosphatase family protein [Spirochaetaceae bacterium]|nr:histidine phosphatase family protein [Spirochaetaceae bacterium]